MHTRVYVQKLTTGAIWSSVNPETNIWRKEFMGAPSKTGDSFIQVGGVVNNFNPFTKKNRRRFVTMKQR